MRIGFILCIASATAFLFTTGLKFTRISVFFQKVQVSIKSADWIKVFSNIDRTLGNLNVQRKKVKIDFSAGYGYISSPEEEAPDLDYLLVGILNENQVPKSPVLWAHQVGKQVIRKVPDTALLGVLVLISSELLRRGVNSNSEVLPPLIREFANATIIELDAKLERLSSLDWKVDPFLRAELENLQTQPLEVIDKFIVTSILPSVDKDFAPFLLKYMVGDTKKVKTITQSLKDLIQLSMLLLERTGTGSFQGPTALDRTTTTIIEQVDLVGQSIEEVVNDWNRIVVQFTGSMTEYLNTDSVLNLLNKQFLLKEGTNVSSSAPGDTFAQESSNLYLNKIPQRTLQWSSKRPWNIDTTIDFIDDHKIGEKNRSAMGGVVAGGVGEIGRGGLGGGGGSDKNKPYLKALADSSRKSPALGELMALEELLWSSLLKSNKMKPPEKNTISTTLLNNITKKPAKPLTLNNSSGSSTSKKTSPTTPSAFTSYLQDLMD